MNPVRIFKGLCLYLLFSAGCLANDARELNVMSFNIRYGSAGDGENHWKLRKDLVFDVFRNHSPDVVGVQEALRFQLDEIAIALPEYGEVGTGRGGGTRDEYSAILYRTNRVTVSESGTFWLSNTPDIPSKHWGNACVRICTWAHFVDLESKQSFYLFNTHLDHHSQISRERGIQLILERIKLRRLSDPFVLTGDFNAGEDNPAIRMIEAAGLVDTFRVLHPEAKNVGTFNGFKGNSTGEKIDAVFSEPSVKVLKAGIVHDNLDGRYPSDHFPVTVRIRFK